MKLPGAVMRGFRKQSRRAGKRETLWIASAAVLLALGIALIWSRAATPRNPDSKVVLAALQPTDDPRVKPGRAVAFSEGCLTAGCHADIARAQHRHPTVDAHACQTCHQPDTGGHRYPLLRPGTDLCTSCHSDLSGHPAALDAAAGGGCLECHTPHASNAPGLLNRRSTQAVCGSCHVAADAGPVAHGPFASGRCEACHDVHISGTTDRHAAAAPAQRCRTCHAAEVDLMSTALYSHAAVPDSCAACHTPHAGEVQALLRKPAQQSCLECHPEIARALTASTVPHAAMLTTEQCTRCHHPHASEHPAMLREAETPVCMGCHSQPVKATDGRTIAAMADTAPGVSGHDRCSACHAVHGGVHPRLLRDTLNTAPIGGYDFANYALCFSCHDPRLAQSAASTQFRDGDRNLHELHLRPGERSRGCAACHSMHASGEPRMIATSVPFEGSGWSMPLGFVPTADGGRCGSGCHEALEYSRRSGGARFRNKGGAP